MSKTMTVEVDDELVGLMDQAVECGDFGSADDIVAEALHIWRISRHAEIERLRELIAEGDASGYKPWPGSEAITARARAEFEADKHVPYRAA